MSALLATNKVYVTANDSLATRTVFSATESALVIGCYIFTAGDVITVTDSDGNNIFAFTGSGEYFVRMPFFVDNGMVFSGVSGLNTTTMTVLYRPGA